jgi:peptidylprolyl isomerase
MEQARNGHFVKIHYAIKLPDGRIMGASSGNKPLGFTIGKGKVLKGLEQGVIGMQTGQSRTIVVPPDQGYGQRNPELVITVNREELPTQNDIKVGRTVQYMNESGAMVNFLIIAADQDTVTLDANHPFAGQELIYEVTMISVEEPI